MEAFQWPVLGCGVGLRNEHYGAVLQDRPQVDWFEAVSENFMDSGGRPIEILEKVRAHYPVVLHGTSLSIGSTDPIDPQYLTRLKTLAERIQPAMISDHLCWSGVGGERLHDLLPLPYTEEALAHVVARIQQVQDALGRRFMVENVSTYVTYRDSEMPEWEFLAEVARRSGCGLLLDLNNIYVNAFNHKFDPLKYLDAIPGAAIGQFHLAGHTDCKTYLFDTHSGEVIDPVWKLYEEALKRWGKISTLIEWDENIPPFPRLQAEAARARQFYDRALDRGIPRTIQAGKTASATVTESLLLIDPPQSLARSVLTALCGRVSPRRLAEAQQWMKGCIQPLQQSKKSPEVALNPQGGVPGKQRMRVYADGYLGRMHEALKEAYEAVRYWVGARAFAQLAEDYARSYPSRDYNLSLAGRHLPAMLQNSSLTKQFPFLPDLAQLEWLVSLSFHAFDPMPLNPQELAGIDPDDWDRLRLFVRPSVLLMASAWPVLDYWAARTQPVRHPERGTFETGHAKDLKTEILRSANGGTQNDSKRPQKILIRRVGTDVGCETMEEAAFTFLAGIQKGEVLGNLFQALAQSDDQDTAEVQHWFAHWSALGLFSGFEILAGEARSF